MKFNEKLIELRKKQGLSQEELAQKLNVTRQTISKWELGETTPEMSKLSELSKLFGMTVDDLLNEEKEVKIEDEKVVNNEKRNKRTVLIIVSILIGLLLIGLLTFGYFFTLPFRLFNKTSGKMFEWFDKTSGKMVESVDKISDKISNEMHENSDKTSNRMHENFDKTSNGMLEWFEKTSNEIQEDFDEEIQQDKNNAGKEHIMSVLEMYKGTQVGINVRYVIDEVITNNKKYKDQVITVIYQGKSITEPKEIQKLKSNFDDMTKYEISYEYNDQGQIYQMEISE